MDLLSFYTIKYSFIIITLLNSLFSRIIHLLFLTFSTNSLFFLNNYGQANDIMMPSNRLINEELLIGVILMMLQ